MSSVNGKTNGTRWWRSVDELRDDEVRALVEREYPSQASLLSGPVSRRQFLKVMGASMALLSMTGCRWPDEEIVPYAHRPENVTPGVPKRFATSMEIGGVGVPLLVTSVDGRPVKVDGNPEHPLSMGKSDAVAQASVLELYDPDRSRHPLRGGEPASWTAFEKLADELRKTRDEGLRVLSEASESPSLRATRERFLERFPAARWVEYEPFPADAPRPRRELARVEGAEVIVCIDDDLLGDHPTAVRNTLDFAKGRRGENGFMNRLHVLESTLTTTGAMADHRYPMPASAIPAAAWKLSEAVRNGGRADGFIGEIARDLLAHRERCLVTAGRGQPQAVHDIAWALSGMYSYIVPEGAPAAAQDRIATLRSLTEEIRAGEVKTLIVLGGNPVFDAPSDLAFADALKRLETAVHLSLFVDETSEACTWHLPRAHYLEAWGDVRTYDDRPGVVQPLIRPLYGGRTPIEVLALLAGDLPQDGYEIVRRTWRGILGEGGFEKRWRRVLHDGFLDAPAQVHRITSDMNVAGKIEDRPFDGFEVVFRPHPLIGDGRFANNAWLQETPDPITRLAWDNAALLSPADAKSLLVTDGDHVEIALGERKLTIPAYVVPGQAEGSITLHAGYGRRRGGRVADGAGTDVYPLRTSDAPYVATGVEVKRVPGHTRLATMQAQHVIDTVGKREVRERMDVLIREATLEKYLEDPEFAKHLVEHPPLLSLWKEHEYEGHRWAMSIDLSACTGCSACIVACTSENNVPVVGKEEVLRGREMHWIRVDRYYGGEPENPRVAHQPVPCMQCENAPCESVCPVGATVHSREGLNDMAYNRCVGTRYCSNNCPFKVRRFNWFRNHDGLTDIQKMVMNPQVTVRSRGVMEKCTYCVQRINAVKIAAKNEGRPVRDGEITPACASVCPADAIVFGDLSDPESRVAKLHASPRDYGLLEELNIKPRTRYLARLRNPAKNA